MGKSLLHVALSRASAVALAAVSLALVPVYAAEGGSTVRTQPASASIVIGFVGGFVRHDNPHHGPVQLAKRIQNGQSKDTYVEVFENRRRKKAYQAILRQLDTNRDGVLSDEERANAHIILFGHSWGAASAVMLARDLQHDRIPVLLTVQVDSVAKLWQNDSIIPANVAEAVNFYQPHGLIHGRPKIAAADPAHTQILGNYREDYRANPIQCPAGASWFDHFTPSHAQSECDPHVWSQIEEMVRQRLAASAMTTVANTPLP